MARLAFIKSFRILNRTIANQALIDASPDRRMEAQRIDQARRGNLSAFNALVLDYQDSLYRWALSLVSDEALADDITQSTFITAFEKLSVFRGGSFRSWLFTIAQNRAFDELRRLKRRPTVSLDEEDEDGRELYAVLPHQAPLPEQALEAAELAAQIECLLDQLPLVFKEVLVLIDREGLDYQEAANLLHTPIGTIKSRLARARLRMLSLLQEA